MDSHEQLFLRVIEAGSLKAAAEQLGLDPSNVSRRIATLEQRLQVKLIQRSTRRSTATEAGQLYYQGLRQLLDEQLALEHKLRNSMEIPTGLLKVAAPHDFGSQFIAPVLQDMVLNAPDLNVELILGSQFEDLRSQGIDVAIRIGQLQDSSLIGRHLGDVPRVIVASPEYLAKRGSPQKPEDLAQHDFIFYTRAQAAKPLPFGLGKDSRQLTVRGRYIVNSVTAIRELALAGQGMHLGPLWAFRDAIKQGALLRVLPQYPQASYPLHALYQSRQFVPAKIRLFVQGLAEKFPSRTF
ncbi:LysR family transcriptional regulator [Bowmanella denitrificans]|uniref:LysR family transcriptional regulator n=1 Tax=Bowmanella denitrificans TaxID=366582 RepID=A0ABP3GBZ8_9ALTE